MDTHSTLETLEKHYELYPEIVISKT